MRPIRSPCDEHGRLARKKLTSVFLMPAQNVNYIALPQNALKISVFSEGLGSPKLIYWKPQTISFRRGGLENASRGIRQDIDPAIYRISEGDRSLIASIFPRVRDLSPRCDLDGLPICKKCAIEKFTISSQNPLSIQRCGDIIPCMCVGMVISVRRRSNEPS